ncbi:MAG TPA: (d)CMP kinase [Spirochaetota bacterium]|nr:(d)CMP kinase [Spirochaetota bacterium]
MTKNKNIVIAIDGPAGSGKSSVAREVAKRMGLQYIDSGALYRAITLYVLEKSGESFTPEDVCSHLNAIHLEQVFNADGSCTTICNGIDVSEKIRSETIASHIGKISDIVEVRHFVNSLMREWARDHSIIVDGRDIGTVVFPDALIKIYLDASVGERAKRRALEYSLKGKEVDLDELKTQIKRRDEQDMKRKFGALKKADDAIYLDTSNMTQDEVVQSIYSLINTKIQYC